MFKNQKSLYSKTRDKRTNTINFNKMAKKRRRKARHDEINRKKNRKCGYRG